VPEVAGQDSLLAARKKLLAQLPLGQQFGRNHGAARALLKQQKTTLPRRRASNEPPSISFATDFGSSLVAEKAALEQAQHVSPELAETDVGEKL
jgi:hypothetical protein